jgi:glycosyltransferase involved in cell wall biosynthesis
LSTVKNHATLIDAYALVARELPESILVIAGQGELEATLKKRVLDLGLAERVFFVGFRHDIPRLLQALDLFILPSLREGLPLALLEAMASGRPVVASRAGGIPEVVGNGPFARLVEPTDSPALFSAMLEFAMLTADERRTLGEQARRHAVAEFNAERMVAGYEALYADACNAWQHQAARC